MNNEKNKLDSLIAERDSMIEALKPLRLQIKETRMAITAKRNEEKKLSAKVIVPTSKIQAQAKDRMGIIMERFGSGLTISEIAVELGVSYSRARQLIRKGQRISARKQKLILNDRL
jgi:DNA-directed RNA polymerase specialized sigma subunit